MNLIAVRRYVIVGNARQMGNVNNHALILDLDVDTLVLLLATQAVPVLPVPAVPRWHCSVTVAVKRRQFLALRHPVPTKDMQLLRWPVSCQICNWENQWTLDNSQRRSRKKPDWSVIKSVLHWRETGGWLRHCRLTSRWILLISPQLPNTVTLSKRMQGKI